MPAPKRSRAGCADCLKAIVHMNAKRVSYFPKARGFEAVGIYVGYLHARHLEHGLAAVLEVIEKKAAKWLPDQLMRDYFRPSTLFRPGHFSEYLAEPCGHLLAGTHSRARIDTLGYRHCAHCDARVFDDGVDYCGSCRTGGAPNA